MKLEPEEIKIMMAALRRCTTFGDDLSKQLARQGHHHEARKESAFAAMCAKISDKLDAELRVNQGRLIVPAHLKN